MTQFSLATSRRLKSEGGEGDGAEGEPKERKEETQWHRVVAWGKQGEACAQYLKKGRPVYVEGMVRTRKYENKSGEEKTAVEVHADEVSFLPTG